MKLNSLKVKIGLSIMLSSLTIISYGYQDPYQECQLGESCIVPTGSPEYQENVIRYSYTTPKSPYITCELQDTGIKHISLSIFPGGDTGFTNPLGIGATKNNPGKVTFYVDYYSNKGEFYVDQYNYPWDGEGVIKCYAGN